MKDTKDLLAGYYGAILQKCGDDQDLAQDICVYLLERGDNDITLELIDKVIKNVTNLKQSVAEHRAERLSRNTDEDPFVTIVEKVKNAISTKHQCLLADVGEDIAKLYFQYGIPIDTLSSVTSIEMPDIENLLRQCADCSGFMLTVTE